MDPFVLSRNAFHSYCSEYVNNNSSEKTNHSNYEKVVYTLNQRYEYFLQTLDRLRTSFEQTNRNHNKDTLTLPSVTSKRSNRKYLHKSNKRRMPKIYITVSCTEHLTQQQPNIRMN